MRYAACLLATVVLTSAVTFALIPRAAGASVADTVFKDHVRALATHQVIDIGGFQSVFHKILAQGPARLCAAGERPGRRRVPLAWSRVDWIDGQPVSVFVYGRGASFVSLFLRPVRRDQWPAHVLTRRGEFSIAWWSNGTFQCWAVSTAPARDLLRMRKLFLNGGEGVRL